MNNIEDIINDLKKGKMVILVDDEDRENEGDLLLAADHVTPEFINFMAKYGRGLICLTLTEDKAKKLKLPLMVEDNQGKLGTNFTVSIDASSGISTGISAADRAKTIMSAILPESDHTFINRPGHVFPLIAHSGGVLYRAGHTEAGCDLAALAGATPASVICEILNDDGTMARLPDLIKFSKKHNIKIGTIADLIEYRSKKEKLIKKISEEKVNTEFGSMNLIMYSDLLTKNMHLALVKGVIKKNDEVMVRVHEPLSILDFISRETSHSWPPLRAIEAINNEEKGVIIFLNYNESQDSITSKLSLKNTALKKSTDLRNYGIGSQILVDIGVTKMKLLAAPRKMPSMTGYGLQVTEFIENNL
ncbi:MAG: 3,4-dihydroxy-2-butanone-4-phosphate synthase [Nitrosomonadales bacterium]|jgi:3,4-dihydroxy 2-butanone 4-phosphate synthase/GTP cyclohydrolase II|nr:3,4-dihydroxy-2-butanone-4-phosphate synthase [Nitrosomonadales bacterium]MBT6232447.1 3,4-dihydroxy-2-butanone-4-phosphate synthase [Nitrosomonadales bacterium]MBT6355589.1 3,4-dihydroxy-2-butanone-4-phosphate synthase [Nitrosomonadales bacterium]|tara:strand:+ start:1186 stop:2268 length:1083 start_codon:yes stop_codon:yes gene_type:complete